MVDQTERIIQVFNLCWLPVTLIIVFVSSCENQKGNTSNNNNDIYDIDANGIPKFGVADYIELGKIYRISLFRSSVGHDYSDDFESCRNMKHYFEPKSDIDWSSVKIFAPVNGIIFRIDEEWAGMRLEITAEQYPAFHFFIFHINLLNPFCVGEHIQAGQQLGTHIGPQTMSDISIGVCTPGGLKFVSYLDVITDSVFQNYQMRGIQSRSTMIISKEERDANPLTCDGEGGNFINAESDLLEKWVILSDTL